MKKIFQKIKGKFSAARKGAGTSSVSVKKDTKPELKDAIRYVEDQFGRAIVKLSER